jgi:hypothetical protein
MGFGRRVSGAGAAAARAEAEGGSTKGEDKNLFHKNKNVKNGLVCCFAFKGKADNQLIG